MVLINGKEVSEEIQEQIAAEVVKLKQQGKKAPHLAAVLVGDDPASQTYVNAKIKACEKVGLISSLVRLNERVTEQELLAKIEELNNNEELDGYIVQLPIPKHISEQKIIEAVKPSKDVD